MPTSEKSYLSCAETAKLVRKALKATFPGVKFSVRSSTYAGGASIDVSWTDGPTSYAVDSVLHLYSGASFDGMIDLKSYHDSMIANEDGSVETVHFGADFVMGQRSYSEPVVEKVKAEIERLTGAPYETSRRYELSAMRAADFEDAPAPANGYGHKIVNAFEQEHMFAIDTHRGEWGSTLVYQYLQDKTLPIYKAAK